MFAIVSDLAPLVCGVLLAVTGAGKLFGRRVAQLAANTVLVRVLGDGRRATLALRTVGAAELAVATALLAAPATVAPGVATAALGVGFTAYLGYARATAPQSSCGCSARAEGPIGVRSFARAALVVLGGVAAAAADGAWWTRVHHDPGRATAVVVVAAALVVAVSADLDRLWLLPMRRLRIKVFGHPLAAGPGAQVSVAASVQLLESSLAWQAASPVVRSGLLDSWDDGGWRVLRFSGVVEEPAGQARPVNVLFALDRAATIDTAPDPAVRVTVVDDVTEEVVPVELITAAARRTALPVVG